MSTKAKSKRLKKLVEELYTYKYYYKEQYKGGTGDLVTLFHEVARQLEDAYEIVRDLEV